MKRYYYSNFIEQFIKAEPAEILGNLTINSEFSVEQNQRDAWLEEIAILKRFLTQYQGYI